MTRFTQRFTRPFLYGARLIDRLVLQRDRTPTMCTFLVLNLKSATFFVFQRDLKEIRWIFMSLPSREVLVH